MIVDTIFILILLGISCRFLFLVYIVASLNSDRTKFCGRCKKWRLASHKYLNPLEGCTPIPIPMAELMRGYR